MRRAAIVLAYLLALEVSLAQAVDYVYEADPRLLFLSSELIKSQVGVRELAGNRGVPEKYQRAAGIPLGSPYCYAGIFWAFDSVWGSQNFLLRTGLASAGQNFLRKKSTQVTGGAKADRGMIFWRKPGSVFGHVEFVVESLPAGFVRCVGFNTGGSNPRDGGGVYYTKRSVRHPLSKMRFNGICWFAPKQRSIK